MKARLALLLAGVLLAAGAFTVGAAPRRERYPLEVQGRPVMYGHEPFSYACIETVDGTVYYVHPDQQEQLRSLPPKLYVFYGRLHEGSPPTLEASQHPAGTIIVGKWKEVEEE